MNVDKLESNAVLSDEETQMLTFLLDDEKYGIEIQRVKEIIEFSEVTHLPLVPDYIRGLLNLRGSVVPVIDLMFRFKSRKAEITKLSCIIIVELATENTMFDIGILVDAVNEVASLYDKDIEMTPRLGANINTEFIEGIAKVNDNFVIMLNVNNVFNLEELNLLHEIKSKHADKTL